VKVETTLLPDEPDPVLDRFDQLRVLDGGVSLSASRRYVVCEALRMGDYRTVAGFTPVDENGAPEFSVGRRLVVIDVETGAETAVPSDGNTDWCPRWSPTQDRIVFYSDAGGRARPWLWQAGEPESRLAADVEIGVIDGTHERASWSGDGTKVYVPTRRTSLRDDIAAAAARPLHYLQSEALDGSTDGAPLDGSNNYFAPADLAVIDVATGEVTARSSGVDVCGIFPSPAGDWVAVSTPISRPDVLTIAFESSLHLLSTETLERVTLATRIPVAGAGFAPAWSPDGKALAWVAGGELFVSRPSQDATPLRIDAGLELGVAAPLWHPAGGSLLAIGVDGIPTLLELGDAATASARRLALPDSSVLRTLASVDGALAGQAVTNLTGSVTVFGPAEGGTFAVTGAGEAIVLLTTETGGTLASYLPLDGGEARAAHAPMTTVQVGRFADAVPGLFVFAAEEFDKPPALWISRDGLDEAQLLCDPNPDLERGTWGSREFVSWTDPEGEVVHGALFLPPGDHDTPPPVVFHVYPGRLGSRAADRFEAGHATPMPWQVLTGHGFAVFSPDLPLYAGYTWIMDPRMTENAVRALDELGRRGLVDPQRAGVYGLSGGGYQVNAFVCQTNRFKAAVSIAGGSDGVSAYGSIIYGLNEPSLTAWAAVTGASPSEDPQVYIRTSPVFNLKNVTTPLLLMHAVNDPVPSELSGEMFVGLRQLGKKVAFARYNEGGHAPVAWPARRDAFQRILGWFQRFLVDEA